MWRDLILELSDAGVWIKRRAGVLVRQGPQARGVVSHALTRTNAEGPEAEATS